MKAIKLIVLAAMCMAGSYASAQDLIVKKDGSVIQAKVTKIGTTEVEYKKWNNQDGPQYSIAVADILAINYQNGEKETFENVSASGKSQTTKSEADGQQSIVQVKTENLSPEAKAANDALIEARNTFNVEFNKSKANNKPANLCVLGYALRPESVVFNGELTIFHTFPTYGYLSKDKTAPPYLDDGLLLHIVNHTNRTVYLDLANSFIVRGLDSESMYVPTATTSSKTSSNGVGVNLGAVTNALGVGGAVGTLAQGVNVGKGNSSTASTTVYSQRVVAIPANSTKVLTVDRLGKRGNTPMNWFRADAMPASKGFPMHDKNLLYFKFDRQFNYGEVYYFDENFSFLNFAVHIGYSFEESCENLKSMKMLFYPKYIIGVGSGNKWKGFNFNRRLDLYIKDFNAFSFFVVNDAK